MLFLPYDCVQSDEMMMALLSRLLPQVFPPHPVSLQAEEAAVEEPQLSV